MLWLVSNTIISLPAKWSAAMIAGPSMKGRDSNFVNGTARVRDDSQSSKHAAAKIARSVRDPRSHDHTAQALISCLGTIDTETDSVRKYVNQQYKYGLQLRKGQLLGSKKSKKKLLGRAKMMARRLALHHNRLWAVLRAEPGRWLGRARCVCVRVCVCVCVCVCVFACSLSF
jgi:hypothetical protein